MQSPSPVSEEATCSQYSLVSIPGSNTSPEISDDVAKPQQDVHAFHPLRSLLNKIQHLGQTPTHNTPVFTPIFTKISPEVSPQIPSPGSQHVPQMEDKTYQNMNAHMPTKKAGKHSYLAEIYPLNAPQSGTSSLKNSLPAGLDSVFNGRLKKQLSTFSQQGHASAANQRTSRQPTTKMGGPMADLSGYRDLSRTPVADAESGNDSGMSMHPEAPSYAPSNFMNAMPERKPMFAQQDMMYMEDLGQAHAEFTGNVQTLIQLVSDLPEGVTKQTGAQIIRLTMEAMGISMEEVLSEAQSAQSEMLDAVRANIKKIEEFKTVIRKLESDIKYYQGKANELSEIIDLFILSNSSSGKMGSDDISAY